MLRVLAKLVSVPFCRRAGVVAVPGEGSVLSYGVSYETIDRQFSREESEGQT